MAPFPLMTTCAETSGIDVDELFRILLLSCGEQAGTNELLDRFRKIWKDLGLNEEVLDGREVDLETLSIVTSLVRKFCETMDKKRNNRLSSFLEFVVQQIVLSEELNASENVEIVLKKLLECSSSLLFQCYGEDLGRIFEIEVSLLRIAVFLFVKVAKVPEKRPKTLSNFAPEMFFVCLFLCYWLSSEDISWLENLDFSKEKIDFLETGPSVVDKKNSAYWTSIRCIQILGIHKRVEGVHSLVGQLWPALQPLFVKTLKYEDYQRKNSISSEHPSFISQLIKYCLSLLTVEELETQMASILRLLVPLSQDFDRQRRIQTIQSFQLLIYRCSSSVVEEHKSSFYIILRVLCRFREPELVEALLECITHFIQKIKARSKDCFDEPCTSEFYQLVDAVIDLVSYCTLSSSSFVVSMNELRRVVGCHLGAFLRVVDKRIYPRLHRLLPCICELMEKVSSSTKCIEAGSFQKIAEALKYLLLISQPFIRFYLQTLVGSILTCVSNAKIFLSSKDFETICVKCIELLEIVRIHSESGIFWCCLNESEEMGKEPPGLDGVTEWIIRYRRHVIDSKYYSYRPEKPLLDTFDDMFENSSNPFQLFRDISA